MSREKLEQQIYYIQLKHIISNADDVVLDLLSLLIHRMTSAIFV